MNGPIEFEEDEDFVIRIVPVSSQSIPEELAATNRPFLVAVPKGKSTVTVKGIVRGEDNIKVTVTVNGQESETRVFHAVPYRQEEEKQLTEQEQQKQEKIKVYVDECNRLIGEHRYNDAVMIAKKACEFAPEEPVVRLLLETVQKHADLQNRRCILKEREPSPVSSEQEIDRQLEKPVTLNFDRPRPLGQVLQLLQTQTGIEFFIDHSALREVDVTIETPISIQLLTEFKLKSVLALILNPLDLTYIVKNELLCITSISKAKEMYLKKTYNVADLVGDNPKPLIDLIEAVVSPESWNEGGEVNSGEDGKLIVVQKPGVHTEIDELLQKLREMNALTVGYLVETAPFDSPGVVQWNSPEKYFSLNGQTVKPTLPNGDKKILVRVQANTSSPVSADLASQNEPFYFVLPAGKELLLQGTVSHNRQCVRLTASFDGIEPQTRMFHAKAFEIGYTRWYD
jgi:hypothetical protein